MMYEIINPDSLFYSKNSKLVDDFMDFSSKNLGFEKPVTIDFVEDDSAGQDPLGKTAHYNPQEMSIVVYTTNRHPKDILRSLSHELIHHCQNCEERIPSNSSTEKGYAQTDKTMRGLESDAYQKGNIENIQKYMNFRDFTDSIEEGQYKMRKNKKQIKKSHEKINEIATDTDLGLAADRKRSEEQPDLIPVETIELAKKIGVEPNKVANVNPSLLRTIAQLKKLSRSRPLGMDAPTVVAVKRRIKALSDARALAALYKATPFLWTDRLRGSGGKKSRLSKKLRQGKHIKRLQQALQDFGMRLKADGIFGRNTQAAINRVRSNWPTAPKRQSNFNKSVKALTDWLEANKNTGRKVKPAPAKEPAPSSGSTNTALDKSADLSKEYDKLMADRRRINKMAPGQLKRDAEKQFRSQLSDFKKKRAAARSGGVSEIIDPALDEAKVSKKSKKKPLRENQKADRNEMLSRILTQRLLGNVKIKNN